MPIANLTSGRTNVRGRVSLETELLKPAWSDSADITYYRGGAVGIRRSGGATPNVGPGFANKTMDGTVDNVLGGVLIRDVVVPKQAGTGLANAPEFPKYGLPVQRAGTFRFNVDGGTLDDSFVGRPVFFRSDWQVDITPPSGTGALHPVWAGYIVKVIDPTTVEVLITPAVGAVFPISTISFGTGSQFAAINNNEVPLLSVSTRKLALGKYFFLLNVRAVVEVAIPSTPVGDVNIKVGKNGGTTSLVLTILQTGSAAGDVFSGSGGAYQMLFDENDTIEVTAQSTADVAGGEATIFLDVLRL